MRVVKRESLPEIDEAILNPNPVLHLCDFASSALPAAIISAIVPVQCSEIVNCRGTDIRFVMASIRTVTV
jgi:hypothetical protein